MPSSGRRPATSCSTRRTSLAAAVLLAAALAIVFPEAASAQCAMCRTALTDSAEGRAVGEQFNRAILLMIAAPYVVMGAVSFVVFRGRLQSAWRGVRRRRPADGAPRR